MNISLGAFQILTVTADVSSSGSVGRVAPSGIVSNYPVFPVPLGGSLVLGPFTEPRNYFVFSETGLLEITIADADAQLASPDISVLACSPTTIPAGRLVTVPILSQAVVYGSLTVTGTVLVDGVLRIN